MPSTSDHVEAIAGILADYREGEIAPPDPDHVGRWLRQFDRSVRDDFIAELRHVLKITYLSRSTVEAYLAQLMVKKEVAGDDPAAFWRRANFLDIQENGRSQHDILKVFGKVLRTSLKLKLGDCGGDGDFVYLDDILFSGNRVASTRFS